MGIKSMARSLKRKLGFGGGQQEVGEDALHDPLEQAQLQEPLQDPVQDQLARPYTHLDVHAPLYNVDIAGDFEGDASQAQWEAARERLVDAGKARPKEHEIRLEMIRGHVADADGTRAQAQQDLVDQGDNDSRVMGMTMLPEWFLGKNLSKKTMKKYRKGLKQISEEHPEVLIQPGTGVWQERVAKSKLGKPGLGKNTVMHSTGDVYFGGGKVHTQDKMFDGMDTNATKYAYGKHKGDVVPKAQKIKWFGDAPERTAKDRDYCYDATDQTGSSHFDVGGRRFAMDICGDHGSDGFRAQQEMTDGDLPATDVHLVTSNGSILQDRGATVRDGGVAIQNDATVGSSFLYTATDDDQTTWGDAEGLHGLHDQLLMPEDHEGYQRRGFERQAHHSLQEDQQGSHLGTWRLPGH
ncbi:MAG TPA: hypothetical protein PKA64_12965 [Myxococcota bacterium]|nr:hypothetical protein [Myxococcota bacterium]